MNEARDENRSHWDRETENNPVRTEMYRFRKRMQRLIAGTERSQMLVGPLGCGKDTAIYPALDAADVVYRRIVDVSAKGLKREFNECAALGIVAIINDADASLWKDEAVIEVLMRATGDDAGRVDMISNLKMQEEYSYKGLRLIIISNRSPFEKGVAKASLAEFKLKPLFRRMKLTVIEASQEERFAYTCYLIICENVLRPLNYPPKAVNEVVETLAGSRNRVNDVSLGMVKNMLVEFVRPDQDEFDNWRTEFESRCNKGDYPSPPKLARIPKIIGADRNKKSESPKPANQSLVVSDLAFELSGLFRNLSNKNLLGNHRSDLGYMVGLLFEVQRLNPSGAFTDGFARASRAALKRGKFRKVRTASVI